AGVVNRPARAPLLHAHSRPSDSTAHNVSALQEHAPAGPTPVALRAAGRSRTRRHPRLVVRHWRQGSPSPSRPHGRGGFGRFEGAGIIAAHSRALRGPCPYVSSTQSAHESHNLNIVFTSVDVTFRTASYACSTPVWCCIRSVLVCRCTVRCGYGMRMPC